MSNVPLTKPLSSSSSHFIRDVCKCVYVEASLSLSLSSDETTLCRGLHFLPHIVLDNEVFNRNRIFKRSPEFIWRASDGNSVLKQNHFNTNRATAQPGRYKTRLCFYKTNCLWSSDEAPTAGANDYKHWSDGYKYLCSYGVILASKTVTCIFSRESDTTGINMMGFGINII